MHDFEAFIAKRFSALLPYPGKTSDAMAYSLLHHGGKRVRPKLVIDTAASYGIDPSISYDLSMAVECIHTYSLIHDDLPCMDDDTLRRGVPTNHVIYGPDNATLAGDGLNTLAFEVIATSTVLNDHQKVAATSTLARMANGMVYGQCIDLASEHTQIDAQTLLKLHQYKTGCLLSAALMLGGIASSHDEDLSALENIGYDLGIAFQFQDDIFDVTKDEVTLGKNNSDVRNEKSTSVSLFGLTKAKTMMQDYYDHALDLVETTLHLADPKPLQDFIHALIKRDH